jgi:acid phosphatase type 7
VERWPLNRRTWFLGIVLAILAVRETSLHAKNSPSAADSADPQPTLTFTQFKPGAPMHLVAYCDMRFTSPAVTSGTNPRVRKWLAARVAEDHPAVLLLTGDMPYTGAKDEDWQVFQQETSAWRDQHILRLPTLGNHEIYGGAAKGIANYLQNFPEIEGHRYYSALLGSIEVISLDCTSGGGAATPQGQWFANQLAHLARQVQFLVILYHIPWVADRQSQVLVNLPTKEALNLRNILETHLPNLHARVVVFNGHIHNYERFERYRVEYVVTGGGGAQPYPLLFRGRSDLYRDTGFPVYNYLSIDVSNRQLHAVMWKVKDPDAPELSVEAKDEFTLNAPTRKVELNPTGQTVHAPEH